MGRFLLWRTRRAVRSVSLLAVGPPRTTTGGDAQGAITFKWQFTCKYTSDIHSVCSGPWHITDGIGDYEGAAGGGTAIDECDDEYNGAGDTYSGTRCSDTLTGKIQVP